MGTKTIVISEKYDPKKEYAIHIRKQVSQVLVKLEKGKQYKLSELVENFDGVVTKKKNLENTRNVIKHVMNIGKEIGVITEINDKPISFENFCKLDTVSYMRKQLSQTKYKNPEAKTKHTGGGTRRSYSLNLWTFSNWIHGKTITTQKAISVGDNLQRIESVKFDLDTVEDLLHAFQESNNRGAEFERFIKEYLMDETIHANKSKGYMGNIMSAIKSYFSKNESPITINFNVNVNHDNVSESITEHISTLSLDELHELLTTGKPSITEKAVVLCKFHAGIDNSTFTDRFNFEAYLQLVKWFGTDKHDSWDLKKCPVVINLTRIKVGFPHISCLDQDAIQVLQKALDWRETKTGEPMKVGQAIFLNTKLVPITDRWVSELIPRLALKAGIQKTFQTKLRRKNEKTSHELRDLLKSTLNSCGVEAYASNHLIGHMPRDSYEKESILYPEKIRQQFMKASKTLNVFTGFTNYVKHGGDEQTKLELAESREKMHELKQEIQKIRKEAPSEDRFREIAKELLDGLKEEENQVFKYTTDEIDRLEKENAKLKKKIKK